MKTYFIWGVKYWVYAQRQFLILQDSEKKKRKTTIQIINTIAKYSFAYVKMTMGTNACGVGHLIYASRKTRLRGGSDLIL